MLRKYASLEEASILEIRSSPVKIRTASLDKIADFDAYRTEDGYLYARIRAISSRCNKNHDGWPSIELAGGQDVFDRHLSSADGFTVTADSSRPYGFSTFLHKPIFVDHHNNDPERARGVIADATFHVDDHRTSSLDPYYSSPDVDPEHLPGTWIELLLEVDAKSFPKFAKAVVEGSRNPKKGIDGWSMGCDVENSVCSICKNSASTPEEYCHHIRLKGAHFDYIDPTSGRKTSKKAYENCYGVSFFEISGVFDPADETALSLAAAHTSKTQEETITQNPKERGLKDLADDQAERFLDESGEARAKRKKLDKKGGPLEIGAPGAPGAISGQLECPNCAGAGIDDSGQQCAMCSGQGYFRSPHPGGDGYGSDRVTQGYGDERIEPDEFGPVHHGHLRKEAPGNQHLPGASPKRNRQYEHIKDSLIDSGKSDDEAKEEAARTVNKQRAEHGETKDASVHLAENPLPQSELSHAPEHVDTLREEEICPVCGSSMDEDTCDVCGYQEPPKGFGNPDLTKAQDVDLPTEPMDDRRMDAPGVDPNEGQPEGPATPEATNVPKNPALVAHVTSDMDWDVHSKTSARINKVEQAIVATDKPQTNEPKEKILSDQTQPVTSRVRTALDFIAAAGATRRNTQMNHTADAASGAPAVAKPDVHTEVTGVGGVDQASNDAASKADAQVDVTAIGGTGVESVGAEKEGVNVEQGDEHSKNIEAIHTDTWGPNEGDSLGQHDPVTSEPWPASEDGVRAVSSWIVEGHDDGPFPPDAGIGGGTAVQGNQPIAEDFGERVNVLEHVTSPSNNSGPTTTWSGTDGNGVNKQQDPVTPESIARGESQLEGAPNWTASTHIFAAFKLADLEVDLGLLPPERKYERAAELERQTPTVVEASLRYAQRVKQAGVRKTAGVSKLPVMGRSVVKEASADTVPTDDAAFMFGGV